MAVGMRIDVAVVAVATLIIATACSGSDPGPEAGPSATSSPATVPSPTIAPEVLKAVDAYRAYVKSRNEALEHPVAKGKKLSREADFTPWTYDPVEAETLVYVNLIAAQGVVYRGKQPISHIILGPVDLDGSPYATVRLTDCQVPQGLYAPYDRATGKRLKLTGGVNLEKTYPSAVKLISVAGHWGVSADKANREGTCDPSHADLPGQ